MAESFIDDRHRKGRILDIGCGTSPYFLRQVRFKEKYGIDPHVCADDLSDGIKLLKTTSVMLPFDGRYFSVVVMLAFVEHISPRKLKRILVDVYRVLKPNGRIIITTPAPWTRGVLSLLSVIGMLSSEEIQEHKKQYSLHELRNLLVDAGFTDSKIRTGRFECGANHWVCAEK